MDAGSRANMNQSISMINAGDQLDHYRLESELTHSPVATTFRATDLRTNREVAIKVPHPDVASDPTYADWFRREQEAAMLLDHPALLKVIPEPEQTQAYMVMEPFQGKLLRQILNEQKRLVPERAVRICLSICKGLEYLHGRGIVHGDLRPETIVVGGDDAAKLLEFSGAAKLKARRLTLTKIAQMTGASDYVSPEEVLGKRIDARSDIYALGLILYEMLTGKQPFRQSDPTERLLNYPIPPREIDPSISPQLQEVVYRALERKPQNRYAGAREFARDLEHLDQVGVADRAELRDWKKHRSSQARKILLYSALALVPIVVFLLMLYFSKN